MNELLRLTAAKAAEAPIAIPRATFVAVPVEVRVCVGIKVR